MDVMDSYHFNSDDRRFGCPIIQSNRCDKRRQVDRGKMDYNSSTIKRRNISNGGRDHYEYRHLDIGEDHKTRGYVGCRGHRSTNYASKNYDYSNGKRAQKYDRDRGKENHLCSDNCHHKNNRDDSYERVYGKVNKHRRAVHDENCSHVYHDYHRPSSNKSIYEYDREIKRNKSKERKDHCNIPRDKKVNSNYRMYVSKLRKKGSNAESLKKTRKKKRKDSKDDAIIHFDWRIGLWLNNRFEVVGKLGEGTFGRVLRCIDSTNGDEVAIKVVRDVERYTSAANVEASILKEIKKLDYKGESNCVLLLDQFMHEDRHMCLVFEKLGLSLYEFLAQNSYRGYLIEDIQQMTKHTLQALSFMYHIKITHTDLKPENILLECSPDDFDWVRFPRRHFSDGYDSNDGMTKRPRSSRVKIIDFGSATFDHEYHCSIINTRQYRAPEVILGIRWEKPSDMWSLGCILIELYTGCLLFKTHDHLEHLAMMEKIIGRIPDSMLEASLKTEGKKYIHHKELRLNWPEGASSRSSIRRVRKCVPISELILPSHRIFAEFVKYLLQIDPKMRPKPNDALNHDFLKMKLSEC